MSDDTKDETPEGEEERVEDRIGQGELLDEFASMTRKFTKAVERTWDSEQRRSVQKRVVEELRTAGDQAERIAQAAHDQAQSTKVGQELTENAEKIGRQVGEGLLTGLKALNRELSKTLEKDEDGKD